MKFQSLYMRYIIIIVIIIIKKGWQCDAGRDRFNTLLLRRPPASPTIPTSRTKEVKGKTVGDRKLASSKAVMKPASRHHRSPKSFHSDTERGIKVRRY